MDNLNGYILQKTLICPLFVSYAGTIPMSCCGKIASPYSEIGNRTQINDKQEQCSYTELLGKMIKSLGVMFKKKLLKSSDLDSNENFLKTNNPNQNRQLS